MTHIQVSLTAWLVCITLHKSFDHRDTYSGKSYCMLVCIALHKSFDHRDTYSGTVNQQILAAIKFVVSQNKVIYVNLAAIKFGVSPRPVYVVYDRRICWRRQILAKTRNSPNSPNIIALQNLLIYSKSYCMFVRITMQ